MATLMEERTVTKAAVRLGVSQSALSYTLERMRVRFADPLFVRVGNKMSPTPFADRLGAASARVLRTVETEMEGLTPFDPATTQREFRLLVNEVGAMTMVPKLIRLLASVAPGARLAPERGDSSTLAKALATGQIDLAAGHFANVDDRLYQQLLFKRDYVCIARRDHPYISDAISLKEFSQAPQILVDAAPVTQDWINALLSKHSLRPTIAMTSQHIAAIPFFVANSDMISIIPKEVYDLFLPIAAIKKITFPVPIPPIDIRQYWHARLASDPALRFFRELVFEATREN
ncbi:LysR family transcriptional regulator [Glaciimonas immobilis]|uniref:DNA-binding transcriptional LysR family regulator n=1 Tax=Glaciimonas immobilis TaxID=728004 RepID=A0A840RQ13_9BURK|nr:LysR family transcriptional regulator [Glaciimonas immobilis]KAF3998187.1 LysR family transcriptional regulator [Glaciimonas immobilis]MBB5199096.1 DNA-binding transcriptional LysR family regulator [Glaciimonas immobilis]